MKTKSLTKRIFLVVFILIFAFAIRYCWVSFPIATGYGAKILCSSVFVSGRPEGDIKNQELSFTPLNLVRYEINYKDSSVNASLFGLARRKAIYRKGLGATLLSGRSEAELKGQQFRLAGSPVVLQDSMPWPIGNRMNDSFPNGINKAALQKAIENMFVETDSTHLVRTRAVVVLFDGKLVGEKYASGFDQNSRLTGWSMSKSITGALVGLLVREGKLNVNAPAPVPEWSDSTDTRHKILLKDLLQQTSGLVWEEDYAKSSDATKMLFQRADMGGFAASHPLKNKPGSVFYYSSGNSNILSRIIRQTVGETDYHAYVYEHLFHKLGMFNTIMEPDASGTIVGSSYTYGTAKDWARFGLLLYNDGIWNDQRVLPEGWVKASTEPVAAAGKGEYGYQIWLNAGEKNNPSNRLYPALPTDMFFADGFEGQNVFVIPSRKLVVVRLGLTRNGDYDVQQYLSAIMAAIR